MAFASITKKWKASHSWWRATLWCGLSMLTIVAAIPASLLVNTSLTASSSAFLPIHSSGLWWSGSTLLYQEQHLSSYSVDWRWAPDAARGMGCFKFELSTNTLIKRATGIICRDTEQRFDLHNLNARVVLDNFESLAAPRYGIRAVIGEMDIFTPHLNVAINESNGLTLESFLLVQPLVVQTSQLRLRISNLPRTIELVNEGHITLTSDEKRAFLADIQFNELPTKILGTVRLNDIEWETELDVTASEFTHPVVNQILRILGSETASMQYRFKLKGSS